VISLKVNTKFVLTKSATVLLLDRSDVIFFIKASAATDFEVRLSL
jgi:hypothetical protein